MPDAFSLAADELDETADVSGILKYYNDPAGFAREAIAWKPGRSLAPYQADVLGKIPAEKRVSVRGPHGLGKALELGVRIPTPSGWSTIGDLRVGDEVFDEHGKPCRVTGKSPVWTGDTYEVEFADGSVITAHGEHEWNAVDVYHRPRTPRPNRRPVSVADWRDHWDATRRVTTAHMASALRTAGGQLRWRIPTARPLELPDADLPVDPYVFGYWLGDGHTSAPSIATCDSDWPSLKAHFDRAGYHHGALVRQRKRPSNFSVRISTQPVRRGHPNRGDSIAARLRALGVLGNKRIPGIYLRASVAQRIELVRGLWDSDGYRQAGGCDEVSLSCAPLADDVAELLRSLGLAVRDREDDSKLYGRVVGRRRRIAARFDFNPYHLARYNWEPRGVQASRHTQRTITAIRKVADRPTQCIEVGSPSHLYLAGDSMIPTHNSTTSALAVLWFALTRDAAGRDWKCVTTAGAWRQLTHYLWPEIRKWSRLIRWDVLGVPPLREGRELLVLSMKLRHGEAFAAASNKPELIEGAHGDSVMYVFDESKAIIAGTFDAAEGAFSGASDDADLEAFALAMSTPGEPNGRFYDIHRRAPGLDDWHARHVTLEEAIAAGRVSREWADRRRQQWGADTAVYNNRVLGEFWSSDEDGVIPLSWIEAANERWHAWDDAGRPDLPGPHVDGVDVARGGEDKTVIAIRRGPVLVELRRSSKEDTMQTAGRVKAHLDTDPEATAVVDVIGIGAGVLDRLREQGCKAVGFNASVASKRRDESNELGYLNKRTEAWWSLRERLDPSTDPDTALVPDDLLLGDLTAPKWRVMSGGKIQVESKDDIKKRIGRSTDDGDAVVQAYVGDGGSYMDAYGVVKCGACSRAYLAAPDGKPRERCPHCGAAAETA